MFGKHGSSWQPVALLKQTQNPQEEKSKGKHYSYTVLRTQRIYEATRHHISTVFSDEFGSKYHFRALHICIKQCS